MFFVVGFHCLLEGGKGIVAFLVDGNIDFGRGCPQNNDALNASVLLEVTDVFAELLHHFPTGFAFHVVFTVETLSVVVVESGSHRHDFLEFVANGLDVLFLEDFGVHGRFVSICRIYVPCSELDIVERCDGCDFVVFEIFLISAFTDTDTIVLSHRADGFGQTFASHQNAGNKGGRHSAEANDHDTELTCCRFCFCFAHFEVFC